MEVSQFFYDLTPDRVLEAVETAGFRVTGRCQALASFENRVYDVELEREDDAPAARSPSEQRRVVKFYRPGRWSREQILEEHRFILDLVEKEVPVVAPLEFPDGGTLRTTSFGEIHYAVFPKVGGRAPDELSQDSLRQIGRLLGRIHNAGASREAPHRVVLGPESYGTANLKFLLDRDFIPHELQGRYRHAVEKICDLAMPHFDAARKHRLHGDCHLGNLLFDGISRFFFVDFDDMVEGPAVQDLWLLIPSRGMEAQMSWNALLDGYEEMRVFDRNTLALVEPLRALRFVHYSAWIARRWEDPAFPLAFPQFGTYLYWKDMTIDLEEQLRLVMNQYGC